MVYNKETKTPGIGSMDMDTVNSLVKANDSRMLINGRRFDGGDGLDGTIRNILGSTRVFYSFPLSDEAVIIGSCRDEENNGIIVFIADEKATYTGAIIEYYPETGYVEAVMLFYDLGLSANYPVNDAYVIDGLLYWNDSNNPPRKLNIQKAKYFVNGNYTDGYPSIDEKVLSLIKAPPVFSIKPHYFTDTTKHSNNLRGSMFQFRYAYIYDDNEKSVASPISGAAAPANDVDYTGEVVGDINVNNGIKFNYNTGHHTVKKIVLYSRIGNSGHWGEIEIIDKAEKSLDNDVMEEYSFYNDRTVRVVDQEIINKQQHAIPLKADSLGYIHTNQILLGGNFEGYDNVATDVVLTPELIYVIPYKKNTVAFSYTSAFNVYMVEDQYGEILDSYCGMDIFSFSVSNLPSANNVIEITIDNQTAEFSVSHEESISVDKLRDGVIRCINLNFDNYLATRYINDPSGNLISSDTVFVWRRYGVCNGGCDPNDDTVECTFDITVKEYNVTAGSYRSWPGFKMGARHRFGIIYYDDFGRKSFINEAGEVYLPFITQNGLTIPNSGGSCNPQNYIYNINYEINHEAPDWATRYQWARQDNLDVLRFSRYVVKSIIDGTTTSGGSSLENKSIIDIGPLNLHLDQNNGYDFSFPESYTKPYVFQKGDRMRFITKTKTDFSTKPGLGCILDYELDVTILGYKVDVDTDGNNVNTNKLIVDYIDQTVFTDLGENTLIEIYTPKQQQDDMLYYEMSELFPIIKIPSIGGSYYNAHGGSVRNQDIGGISALGTFVYGDVYSTPIVFDVNLSKSTDQPVYTMLEMASASSYFDSEVYDRGRPNITNKNAKQKKYLNIRTSGKYFEGTEINGLSEFYADNDIFVSAEFGNSINGLKEVGFTLKVLQSNKLTSFFIGRTGLQLAAGDQSQLMADSGDTISTKTPSKELFGTDNKESVLVANRHLYYIDVKKGAIIRNSANGSVDITEVNMKYELKALLKDIYKTYIGTRIITSYNPKTNEVGFTIIGVDKSSETNYGTYYFKDDVSVWSDMFEFYKAAGSGPMGFASINQYYMSFIDNEIWLHESNTLRNNFYGEQKQMSIKLIFNSNALSAKLFRIIEITGKGLWGSPEFGDIVIEEQDAVGRRKQESRLLTGKFKNVKGKLIATFLKDSNTQDGANKSVNLHTGKDMKGFVMGITLKNNDQTEAFIETVSVLYQILEIT